MDKTVEIILVAMVTLLTALVVVYMVQGEADSFGGFLDNQQSDAQCSLWKDKIENCRSSPEDAPDMESCELPSQPRECRESSGTGSSP